VKEKLRFRRIRLGVSRAGALFIVFTIAAGAVAVNSGNNLLFLLVAAVLALFAVSGILAYINIQGLLASLALPEEVFAGHPATVSLELTNAKRWFGSYLLACGDDGDGHVITDLPAGRTGKLPFRKTFSDRGYGTIGEITLMSEFPFGLVRRGGTFTPPASCLVFPRPLAVSWKMIEDAEREGDESEFRRAGVGGDYRGLRDYQQGDNIARVDWKGWLRHRRLLTKEFESEGAAPVTFSWDGVPGPDSESRIGQLTWLVRTSFRRGRAVGLVLPDRSFPPAGGSSHRRALLTALALFENPDGPSP
jgi:uncharacterized protein (DUF58 family)